MIVTGLLVYLAVCTAFVLFLLTFEREARELAGLETVEPEGRPV